MAKITQIIIDEHISKNDDTTSIQYEVRYESGLIRKYYFLPKTAWKFLDESVKCDEYIIENLTYMQYVTKHIVIDKSIYERHFWFSCASMEDSPCNDCIGTYENAMSFAQLCANEIQETVIVNEGEEIVDFAYPDSNSETEESFEEQPEDYSESENNYVCSSDDRFYFTNAGDCEDPENCPCLDFIGTLEKAVEYAQKVSDSHNMIIAVNNFFTNDIEDVVYPVVSEQPESESEVKECGYCRECIHYEQCSVYAPEKMECRTVNRLLCGSVVCCEDFVSRKSIDDIYEEQKEESS